jgi:demethylmenaquinone methyltransferase/2-methoxy-6-polyprenyl-1,4-benzoquinol methylase
MTNTQHPRDRAVRGMFDDVAPRYDLLNRIISWRLDGYWRREAVRAALAGNGGWVLDLGSGTGDLTFAAAAYGRKKTRIVGLDFSFEMLRRAEQKKFSSGAAAQAYFVQGSALAAPLKSHRFDAVISAFVLRNVSDLAVFFAESQRVLKPGGTLVTLDMFPPPRNWFSAFYALYFYRLVPWIGATLSRGSAYRYLSKSVQAFHSPESVAGFIHEAGFERVAIRKFLTGAVCIHTASKPG